MKFQQIFFKIRMKNRRIICILSNDNCFNCQKPSFAQFYAVLPSFTQFCAVLPSFERFCWIFLPISFNSAQFRPVLPSFPRFSPVLPSFAQFCPVLPSFFPVFPSFSPNFYHLKNLNFLTRAPKKKSTPAAIITLFFPALLLSRATSHPDSENFKK